MRRRMMLAGLLGVATVTVPATSGCGSLRAIADAARERADPRPDPVEPLIGTAILLAARYAATQARHPAVGDRCAPLRAAHEAHAGRLLDLLAPRRRALAFPGGTSPPPAASAPAGSPGGTGSPGATAMPAVPAVPDDPVAALRVLAEAETAAADRTTQQCVTADPARAALLGSIAAAQITHAAVLG